MESLEQYPRISFWVRGGDKFQRTLSNSPRPQTQGHPAFSGATGTPPTPVWMKVIPQELADRCARHRVWPRSPSPQPTRRRADPCDERGENGLPKSYGAIRESATPEGPHFGDAPARTPPRPRKWWNQLLWRFAPGRCQAHALPQGRHPITRTASHFVSVTGRAEGHPLCLLLIRQGAKPTRPHAGSGGPVAIERIPTFWAADPPADTPPETSRRLLGHPPRCRAGWGGSATGAPRGIPWLFHLRRVAATSG